MIHLRLVIKFHCKAFTTILLGIKLFSAAWLHSIAIYHIHLPLDKKGTRISGCHRYFRFFFGYWLQSRQCVFRMQSWERCKRLWTICWTSLSAPLQRSHKTNTTPYSSSVAFHLNCTSFTSLLKLFWVLKLMLLPILVMIEGSCSKSVCFP